MITIRLDSPILDRYIKTHERFPKAFEALKALAASAPEDGRYEIDGDNIYALVQTYNPKLVENASFETHQKYIDIQYILEGGELMGHESEEKLEVKTEYKPDVQKFYVKGDYDIIKLYAGELAIFFENEPHAPGITLGTDGQVRKIVVKVLA